MSRRLSMKEQVEKQRAVVAGAVQSVEKAQKRLEREQDRLRGLLADAKSALGKE